MVEGRCLCGSVRFQFDAAHIALINNCYCKRCQRSSGAGFVTQLQIPHDDFAWLQGEELIMDYESSPGLLVDVCSECEPSDEFKARYFEGMDE